MDRNIVYPGSIPLDSDVLSINRNTMVALGGLMRMVLGTGIIADGLVCNPTVPASLSITVGPGSITMLAPVDATNYGSLLADTTDLVVKMGINQTTQTFTLVPPVSSGQAINYLVQASFSETDINPAVLPYFNAANPALPFSGPGGTGTAQNTQRVQRVLLEAVPGAPAAVNSQVTPAPDSGWVGLYVITVFFGQTSIGGGTILPYAAAPFLQHKLPALSPGTSNIQVMTASQTWTPPQGVSLVRLRMSGGGGGGGAGGGGGGGGGAGGGSVEGFYPVTAGSGVVCTVGAGGAAGSAGASSSFGTAAVASGGGGGAAGASGSGGAGSAAAGTGSGTGLLLSGRQGQSGFASSALISGGTGGASAFGEGALGQLAAPASNVAGAAASLPGGGGAGGVGSGAGGMGAPGIIIVEW